MAHFARVVNGVVVKVHVLANPVISDSAGVEHEELGRAFLAELHGYDPDEIIQCSYRANFRGTYPNIGFAYDAALDIFIPPAPFGSWIFDQETGQWVAPIAYPAEGDHDWDEEAGDWVEVPETEVE